MVVVQASNNHQVNKLLCMQYTGVCILCLCTCVFHFHITIMGVSRLFLGGASTHLSFISAPHKTIKQITS